MGGFSLPASVSAPTDWSQAAGAAPSPVAPSMPASSPNDGDLLKQLGAIPTAPTAPQYTATTAPAVQPRLPVSNIKPMLDNNRQPLSNQATSLKQARRQNTLANITNAINSFTNKREQQKQENLKTDITNVMRSQQQIANAQQVLNDPSASQETKAAAKQVLDSNMTYLNATLGDDKKRKELAKAFDISFTDPSKNDTPEVKAGQAAIADFKKNSAAGVTANTPQEKIVDQHVSGEAQKKSYAEQFVSAQPQQLNANPQYEAQLKQYNDQQKYAAQYLIPKIIDQQTKQLTTQMLTDASHKNKLLEVEQKNYQAQLRSLTDLQKQSLANQAHLQGIAMQNAQRASAAQIRAQTALQIAGMKDAKGNWKEQAFQNQALMSFTNEIGRATADNKSMQDQIDSIQTTAKAVGRKLSPVEEDLINRNRNTIDLNNAFINQMTDNRQKLTTKLYGTPVGTPTGNTKGYMIDGRPQSAPAPNGSSDDSAAAASEADYIKSDKFSTAAKAFLDSEDDDEDNTDF